MMKKLLLLMISVMTLFLGSFLISYKEFSGFPLKRNIIDKETVTPEMAPNCNYSFTQKVIEQNPGCLTRDLNKYTALDLGIVYHHPSIVHYAKFGNPTLELNFREYVSVLSAYKFVKPDKVIFHTYPKGLSGKYWEMIKKWKNITIEVNHISPIHKIQGKKVKWIQHVADYVKLNAVLQQGGLALDFDVVIINGSMIKNLQKYSECVLVGEFTYINGGFYSCIQSSSFMARWLDSYHNDYQPNKWIHNISYRPLYLLTDQKSDTCYNVHVDNTVCANPLWPGRKEWLKKGGVNWKNKMAAHYFVKEKIPNDGEGLLKGSSSLAELITYVYKA